MQTIKATNTKSKELTIREKKDELKNLKYDKDRKINLFISGMEMKFNELKEMNHEPSSEKKYKYL